MSAQGFYFVDPAARFKRVVASAPELAADYVPASNGYELEAYKRYEIERAKARIVARPSCAFWHFSHGGEAELVHVFSRRKHEITNPFSVRATRGGLFIWVRPDQLFATRVVQGKQVYYRDLITREQLDALPVW